MSSNGAFVEVLVVFWGLVFIGLGIIAYRTQQKRRRDSDYDLKNNKATILSVDFTGRQGQLEIQGELWAFICDQPLQVTDSVTVQERQGLTLLVKKKRN